LTPEKIGLFLVDSLRYDCLSYQSDKKHLLKESVSDILNTPTLDEICNESICFNKCYSVSAATVQVAGSMFTGTSQANHGMINNQLKLKRFLNEKLTTMAEILQKLGYITVYAAETSAWFKAHKLLKGFEHDLTKNDKSLFEFLEKNQKEKIFLFSHFEDVHAPYLWCFSPLDEHYNDDYFDTMIPLLKKYNLEKPKEPTEYWQKILEANSTRKLWLPIYLKGINKFDNGRFKNYIENLKKIGFLDKEKSLLVITSDHGDGKYRNDAKNSFNHNGDAFDEIARIPLIVRLPSLKHEIRDDLVSNIDIFKIIIDSCTDNKSENFVNHKLHCINPFYEKRKYAWNMIIPELYSVDPIRYYIRSRAIITNDKKYFLRGKPETFLNPKIFDLPYEDFVLKIYLDLLGRMPTENELTNYVEKLETKFKPKQLYELFLTSKEYKKKLKWFILDLKNDPFEENEIDPSKNREDLAEFLSYFNQLIDLDHPDLPIKNEVNKEEIDSKELEEIEKELHKLGYV